MATLPTVQDKSPRPPGLLPKNVQSWLLAGLAVLMVLIMWLTSGSKPAVRPKAVPLPAVLPPLEVNEAKIVELQKRIEDLQREQAIAQNALHEQSRALLAGQNESSFREPLSEDSGRPAQRPDDPLEAERKKREYLSLFASNIALSYRKPAPLTHQEAGVPGPPLSVPGAAQPVELPKPPELETSLAGGGPQKASREESRTEVTRPVASPFLVPVSATGKRYVLFEGTVLEAVLLNRLDGQFAGPVECLVTNDVYSHDRQHLLIPSGSKLLGETHKVEAFQQTRLAVVFHRLVMPDGYSASLDRFQGLNQIGDSGLRDQVNSHYLRFFGASLAVGAIGAVAAAGTSGPLIASGSDAMRQGFAASTAQSSLEILDRFLNVLPTVTIREGHRVRVYLSGDLALPDYANHAMPGNL